MKTAKSILMAILASIPCLADEDVHDKEQLSSIKPSEIAYVSFVSETGYQDGKKITELFRVTQPDQIRTLLTALQETGKEESQGASFTGYLPHQYYIGTNGEVVVEGVVYLDRNVSARKTTSLSGGQLVEDSRQGWDGPFRPNRRYTRLVYDLLAKRAPEVIKKLDLEFLRLGGIEEVLGLNESTKAQRAAPLSGLASSDFDTRRRAALALHKSGDNTGVPAIIEAMGTLTNQTDRNNAIVALRITRDTRSIPALIKATSDPAPYVRIVALAALGELVATNAYTVIVSHVTDLERLDGCILQCPGDSACYALGALGDKRALPVLIQALDLPETQGEACLALEKLTGQRFRYDVGKWKAWWKERPTKEGTTSSSGRS